MPEGGLAEALPGLALARGCIATSGGAAASGTPMLAATGPRADAHLSAASTSQQPLQLCASRDTSGQHDPLVQSHFGPICLTFCSEVKSLSCCQNPGTSVLQQAWGFTA